MNKFESAINEAFATKPKATRNGAVSLKRLITDGSTIVINTASHNVNSKSKAAYTLDITMDGKELTVNLPSSDAYDRFFGVLTKFADDLPTPPLRFVPLRGTGAHGGIPVVIIEEQGS